MKRLIMMLAMAAVIPAFAVMEEIDGYTWTYTVSNGKATIIEVSPAGSGKVTIPSAFSSGSISVVSIGEGVFCGCASMTIVTLPEKLEHIEASAFKECTALTFLNFPPSVKYIDYQAFYGCDKLSFLVFGTNTLMSALDVENDAFGGCAKLNTIKVNFDLSAWCQSKFANAEANPLWYAQKLYGRGGAHNTKLSIPSGTTRIGDYAFCHCDATNAVIPASVQSIGEHAFFFSKLESVRFLGMGLKSIGNRAFNGCYLTEFTIPPGVTNVGVDAFCDCPYLKTMSIPHSVRHIGDGAFQNTKLTTVYVDYGDKARVKTMLQDSGFDTAGITFEEHDLSTVTVWFGANDVWQEESAYIYEPLGDLLGKVLTPTWGGHEFLGWFTAPTDGSKISESTVVTEQTWFYAHWKLKEYRLSFNANGGTCAQTYIDTEYCQPYGALPVPKWAGREFQGWFTAKTGGTKVTSSTKCIGNLTVYAQWKMKQYKLTFNGNGGTSSPAYVMVDYCKTCDTFPTPTWGGHTFNGWFTARTGGTKVTAPWKCTGNKTIYAQWTVKQYKLTFDGNGGTVSPSYAMVDYCKTYDTFPTPTWGGHTFNGWFTARSSGTKVSAPWKCTGNKTIYAQWTVKQYTITYNANGGTVSPASQKVNYCATYTLPTPTWSGHTFQGWYTAKTGGTKVTSPAKCTGNATLYARWK